MDFYAITSQRTLDLISRHCPRALSTYTICLSRANNDGTLFLTKKEIINHLSESYIKFRNNLKSLALEDLLDWQEVNDGLVVNLILNSQE